MLDELKQHDDDDNGWERAQPEDPNRCQGSDKYLGQCRYKAVPGSKYCPRHKGDLTVRARERANLREYQLGRYQQAYKEFATDPAAKSLRQEIGLARMLLEEIFKRCQANDNQLIVFLPRISEMVERIRKLVESCHRIEERLGVTIDRQTMLQMGEIIIATISEEVTDPIVLERLANKILIAIVGEGLPTEPPVNPPNQLAS